MCFVSPIHTNRFYVSLNSLPFTEQLAVTRNTDIFIGIHGAGLTHLLFLPRWASLFELYNCNDESCYRDLARLRGVHYVTWQRPDLLRRFAGERPEGYGAPVVAHDKFMNYRFDVGEFVRLVDKAAQHVWNTPEYQDFMNKPKNDREPEATEVLRVEL